MTATINGVVVTGTPAEIAELMKLSGLQVVHTTTYTSIGKTPKYLETTTSDTTAGDLDNFKGSLKWATE